jgi:hypothetical protein
MKLVKNSIIIENATCGLNSLKKKDTTFNKEGNYYLIALLTKGSEELQSVMTYLSEVLKKENLTIKKEMKRSKSPIEENKCDGDIVFESLEGAVNDRGELKGEYLKGTYGIKVRTTKDFKVIDMDKKLIDKTQVNWSGAKLNIHCTPYVYQNSFGKGLTIILNNIQVISQGFGADTIEDAFGEIVESEDNPF